MTMTIPEQLEGVPSFARDFLEELLRYYDTGRSSARAIAPEIAALYESKEASEHHAVSLGQWLRDTDQFDPERGRAFRVDNRAVASILRAPLEDVIAGKVEPYAPRALELGEHSVRWADLLLGHILAGNPVGFDGCPFFGAHPLDPIKPVEDGDADDKWSNDRRSPIGDWHAVQLDLQRRRGADRRILGVAPTHVLVPLERMGDALAVLPESLKLLPLPATAGEGFWYMLAAPEPKQRPLLVQTRTAPRLVVANHDWQLELALEVRGAAAPLLPQLITRCAL